MRSRTRSTAACVHANPPSPMPMTDRERACASASSSLPLDQLPDRQWATVRDVARQADAEGNELALRLTEIGFVPGEAVRIMARGMPGREPLAVRLGHTTFALRRHEAALIQVVPGATGHD